MEIVLGAFGALLAIASFCAGIALGYQLRGAQGEQEGADGKKTRAVPDVDTRMKKQLEAEQKAFDTMMNYNPADAYGMNRVEGFDADE